MNTVQAKKILIVEDVTPMRHALRDKLVREGFSVLETKNGEEGLEVALREHPDLLLLDIIMPKMDGMAVLKKLRVDAWGKTAKVILLTNLSETEKMTDAMAQESCTCLIKSDWKIEDVVTKIREQLGEPGEKSGHTKRSTF